MLPSSPSARLQGHSGAIYDAAWCASTESWCTAGGDGVVATWAQGWEHGKALFHHASPFYAVTTWDGGVVAGNATGEVLGRWGDSHTAKHVHRAPVFSLHADDEGMLWTGDGQGQLVRWKRDEHGMQVADTVSTDLGKIRSISSHPQGLLVAGGHGFWAILSKDGTVLATRQAHERSCYWAIHLPEKQAVISGGQDGKLVVCLGEERVVVLPIHQSAVYRGVRCGDVLWTAGRDKDVKAWDVHTLEPVGKLERPHARSVNALALGGAAGAQLATGGDDRMLKVWDL